MPETVVDVAPSALVPLVVALAVLTTWSILMAPPMLMSWTLAEASARPPSLVCSTLLCDCVVPKAPVAEIGWATTASAVTFLASAVVVS